MQYNKAMKALKKSTSNGEKNEEKSTDNGSKSHEDEGNDGSSLNAGVEASGEGKSSAHLEFAGKNIYLSANGKIMVYINKDDVHIFELDLVIDEGKSHSSASDMNDSWNTEVMTDQDGNRYQGIANIRGATFNQKISGDIDIVVNACTNCNTVPLAPGAKANGPLGEATVSGSDMWLPTSRVLYRNDVAGHELGHNLGLRNCSSCNSIMTNSSRYKDVKATLQDIKTLYNGYR
ncbi:hypothetical protein [Shewanella phaeophyticola]|uniref:Peptidase M10 metallopeptidase domain-containing protein n=1 Tax=Shewanella phaeophyticola TaxID=2978345 RepID=A0ABT2NZY4_9GAMM|nr:hypothetical protein [Shewanella sp. KJ10-1]MCT8985953.1 hypothetical protein [Shewanella sp. KJ10-1]